MLFKTRELHQTIRPLEYRSQSTLKTQTPPLDLNINLSDILISDINSNEDLLVNTRDQFKLFFFEDLTYFSWSNFLSTIRIFQYGSANGIDVLANLVKKEVEIVNIMSFY